MSGFSYERGELFAESVPISTLVDAFGTPVYVYSVSVIRKRLEDVRRAFEPVAAQIHYAVKACSNVSILRLLADWGSGFDVVSGGEIDRCLIAGARANQLVFAGVGKTSAEIVHALRAGVGLFHVESLAELESIAQLAEGERKVAAIALRINPGVDAGTHHYITTGTERNKFGLEIEEIPEALRLLKPRASLSFQGFHVHVGSQITSLAPFERVAQIMGRIIEETRARGIPVRLLNLGGGFPVPYREKTLSVEEIAAAVVPTLKALHVEIALEPGRVLVAEAGALIMRVTYVKPREDRCFVVTDAGMNDFLRPALYQAWHPIEPVRKTGAEPPGKRADVVGPLCESGDFLGLERDLPPQAPGDLLALFHAGAYGSVMSNNYNSRPRPPEVLVDGDKFRLIRRRETVEDLIAAEVSSAELRH